MTPSTSSTRHVGRMDGHILPDAIDTDAMTALNLTQPNLTKIKVSSNKINGVLSVETKISKPNPSISVNVKKQYLLKLIY